MSQAMVKSRQSKATVVPALRQISQFRLIKSKTRFPGVEKSLM